MGAASFRSIKRFVPNGFGRRAAADGRHLPGRPAMKRAAAAALVVVAATCTYFSVARGISAGSQQTGAGRLLVESFGFLSLYAIDPDPAIGTSTYDLISSFPNDAVYGQSVSPSTGTIAYLLRHGNVPYRRVWVMNADGSGRLQITPESDSTINDIQPQISPDGTKVAFISNRFTSPTFPNGETKQPEVFVVNVDGTNLHQVTPSEQASAGSNHNTYVDSFGWAGSSLIVAGARVVQGQAALRYGLFRFDGDGTNQTLIKDTTNSQYGTAVGIDVSADQTKVAYYNSTQLYIFSATDGSTLYTLLQPDTGSQLNAAGTIRFSPDGNKVVYSAAEENGSLRTINLDATGRITVKANIGIFSSPKWWAPGPAVPAMGHMEMKPDVVVVPNDGTYAQSVPTLYDANGATVIHAGVYSWVCDATHPCTNHFNPIGNMTILNDGRVRPTNIGTSNTGGLTFCASNAGLEGCNVVALGENFAEIKASVPNANTNGTGGPGIFTIKRTPAPGRENTPLNVNFVLGGTAVRGVDYALDAAGTNVIMPAGQTTFDIKVTPLRAAGNKTVTLSIAAPNGAIYATIPTRDTSTVNLVDNGAPPTALTLSSLTPPTGGNAGFAGVSIYGRNINAAATVKLQKSGQPDVPGTGVAVNQGGSRMNATFDLRTSVLGAWDVVVTNPDNSTATLPAAFTVVETHPTNLHVTINGPSDVRADHPLSEYNIVYSNEGDEDVFGALLVITGLPENECSPSDPTCSGVTLNSPIADIPDIPGQNPFPSWVRQMPKLAKYTAYDVRGVGYIASALPVLIPRIKAHTSGVFSFKVRWSYLTGNELFRIGARIYPPLLRAADLPTGVRLVPVRSPDDDASASRTCASSLISNALGCALSFIPGKACVNAGVSAIFSVAQVIGGISMQGTSAVNVYSGTQLFGAAVSLLSCTISATPLGLALSAVSCIASASDAAVTCIDAYMNKDVRIVSSHDPNEKEGISGVTPQNYVTGNQLFYGITFENDAGATAPAQDVVVTDQLDTSRLDISTFSLGKIQFGDTVVDVPPGLKTYSTEVDLRPANNLLVEVSATIDENTGLVTWQLHSLDPFTRQPPTDPFAGFLPPNVIGTEGQGNVQFYVTPKAKIVAGDEIRNKAVIVFDTNPPIETNEWLNTYDNSKPVSSVSPLAPQQSSNAFIVNWGGTDTGSGVKDYTIYVSQNGGPFTEAVVETIGTSTLFFGNPDTTYAFYSIARDQAGNIENGKTTGEAVTHTPNAVVPATISISGRITRPSGQGMNNTTVRLVGEDGIPRFAKTGPFGYYLFTGVPSGGTYVIGSEKKNYAFPLQIVTAVDNLSGIDLVADH